MHIFSNAYPHPECSLIVLQLVQKCSCFQTIVFVSPPGILSCQKSTWFLSSSSRFLPPNYLTNDAFHDTINWKWHHHTLESLYPFKMFSMSLIYIWLLYIYLFDWLSPCPPSTPIHLDYLSSPRARTSSPQSKTVPESRCLVDICLFNERSMLVLGRWSKFGDHVVGLKMMNRKTSWRKHFKLHIKSLINKRS